MTPDPELLATFARTNSEDAFAELVKRHVNLVYSAALRQVGGDVHLAQDVAQSVFSDLARKAGSLARRETLTGWLYTSAHFAAAKIVRSETRRRAREETFMREPAHDAATEPDWEKLRPVLDHAMHELKESDREAILLRYFENRPFAEVGTRLGLNENAARMRVDRALEKLRAVVARRGLAATATLASVISAQAVQLAPVGLIASLSTNALAAATATGTFALFKLMTAAQLKLTLATLAVAGAATALVMQHQATETMRADNAALTQELAQSQADNQSLSNRLASAGDSPRLTDGQLAELLKLRDEVSRLRSQSGQLARLQTENQRLRALPAPIAAAAPARQLSPEESYTLQQMHTVNALKQLGLAMRIYSGDNHDQLATNFDQLKNELGGITNFPGNISLNNFEFVNVGLFTSDMPDVIMLREITPRQTPWSSQERAYCLADGSVQEVSGGNDGGTAGFDKFETEHQPPPPKQ